MSEKIKSVAENYAYFLSIKDTLIQKYENKYVTIFNGAVKEINDSFDCAYTRALASYRLGTFIIQHCGDEVIGVSCFYPINVVNKIIGVGVADCHYCLDIYNTTIKSHRRGYKYCPMCGKKILKERFVIR